MPIDVQTVNLILLIAAILLLLVNLFRKSDQSGRDQLEDFSGRLNKDLARLEGKIDSGNQTDAEQISRLRSEVSATLRDGMQAQTETLNKGMQAQTETLNRGMQNQSDTLSRGLKAQSDQLLQASKLQNDTLTGMKDSMVKSLADTTEKLTASNEKKLDEIRGVVDEKLQESLEKRISESFRTVSAQLEQVYKGLGEMQHLAADVGGLKQVLSGVKTRGILGEIQLGAILEEILAPEQYDTNVPTVPGSRERVEFAVKLPGADGGNVYLPIDSKFPGDAYMHYQEALQSGDQIRVQEAKRQLSAVLRKSARDIREKYVEPPHTTAFGILFLPFEGLYADVVNLGLLEVLQRDYSINVAGPSTMAALLNSLQMGFRTLAIQKRSGEVWQVLGEVKTEFGKFEDTMKKMQTHLRQTSDDLDNLMGTRSRAIQRKLRAVSETDAPEENLLGIEEL